MPFFPTFVVPPTLATPEQFATWIGNAPPNNAIALLRSASALVLDATEGAFYDVDPLTGLATDTNTKQAMQDATCIQAAAWNAIGYDPLSGGVITSTVKGSKKIGSASVTVIGAEAAAASQAASSANLVPEALRKLQQNNLLGTAVGQY